MPRLQIFTSAMCAKFQPIGVAITGNALNQAATQSLASVPKSLMVIFLGTIESRGFPEVFATISPNARVAQLDRAAAL